MSVCYEHNLNSCVRSSNISIHVVSTAPSAGKPFKNIIFSLVPKMKQNNIALI